MCLEIVSRLKTLMQKVFKHNVIPEYDAVVTLYCLDDISGVEIVHNFMFFQQNT